MQREPKLEKKTIDDYLEEIEGLEDNPSGLAQEVYDTVYVYMMDRDFIRNTPRTDFLPMDDFSKYFLPDFKELLYALHKQVEEMVIEAENDEEIKIPNNKNTRFLKEFLYDPIEAMKKQTDLKEPLLDKLIKAQKSGAIKSNKDFNKMADFNRKLRTELLEEKEGYNEFVRNKKNVWRERQNRKAEWFNFYFNDELINNAVEKNKGGFFENLFGTTSDEYKEFSRRLVTVKQEGPEKGDLGGLRESAFAYLKHKLKGAFSIVGNGYFLSSDTVDKLDKTSQGRVRLCLNVIDAANEAEKNTISGIVPNDHNKKEILKKINEDLLAETKAIGKEAQKVNKIIPENNIIENDLVKDINQLDKNINFQSGIKNDIDDNFISNNIDSDDFNNNLIENNLNK